MYKLYPFQLVFHQDVQYMAVLDEDGLAVAHSDPAKIGAPFDRERKITHLGPGELENWELVTLDDEQRIFEVHRHFRPLTPGGRKIPGHMQRIMMNGNAF